MNRTVFKGFLPVFFGCLLAFFSTQARSQDADLAYSVSFTEQELDDILAPIALYPDPLLAQLLPASTYPEEVADADAWLRSGGDASTIDEQAWAESVRAIADYPDVLAMMAGNMDWTANLGDAFLNQPEEVTNAIQRLRQRARDVGNLASNAVQNVIIDGGYTEIVPAQPQYIYVPVYEPSVVYVQAPTIEPLITFGFGLAIGGWLTMDFDWRHHHVFYHGWDRPGWVNHARPYVHIRNVYINRSRPAVNQIWRHDRSHGDPARYLASRPSGPNAHRYARIGEARRGTETRTRPGGGIYGQGGDARAYSNRGRESRGIGTRLPGPSTPRAGVRPVVPRPNISRRPAAANPNVGQRPTIPAPGVMHQQPAPATQHVGGSGSNRPGSVQAGQQPARTPSVTFGGYRGAGEAKTQSVRGQTSRQSSEQARPAAPPAKRGNDPAGRDNSRDRRGR